MSLVQMDLGCPAVPYEPEVYFVDEQGAEPAAGMVHDGGGGVTVLALLRLAREFEKPTAWAAIEASEMLSKNLTLLEAGEALVAATPRHSVEWCWSRSGTFNSTGARPHSSGLATATAAALQAVKPAAVCAARACCRSGRSLNHGMEQHRTLMCM